MAGREAKSIEALVRARMRRQQFANSLLILLLTSAVIAGAAIFIAKTVDWTRPAPAKARPVRVQVAPAATTPITPPPMPVPAPAATTVAAAARPAEPATPAARTAAAKPEPYVLEAAPRRIEAPAPPGGASTSPDCARVATA